MRDDKGSSARKTIRKLIIFFLIIFYFVISLAYYRKPDKFFYYLLRDQKQIHTGTVLGKISLVKLLPSLDKAVEKYKKLRMIENTALVGSVSLTKRAFIMEKNFVGYFSFFLPTIMWERLIYYTFFALPVLFLSLLYFGRLWQLKVKEIFITDPVLQQSFMYLYSLAYFFFLFSVGIPVVELEVGVIILYIMPFLKFGEMYYSGAWLWRRRR